MRDFPFSPVSHVQLTMFALAITVLITFRISEPLLLATCITAQLKCVLLKNLRSFSSLIGLLTTTTLMKIA